MGKLTLLYIFANLFNVCFPHWILLSAPTWIHFYILLWLKYTKKSQPSRVLQLEKGSVLIILSGGRRYSSGPILLSIAVIKYSVKKTTCGRVYCNLHFQMTVHH